VFQQAPFKDQEGDYESTGILRAESVKEDQNQNLTIQWLMFYGFMCNLTAQLLLKQVFTYPTMHLIEHSKIFEQEFGIKLSKASMSRLLKSLDVSVKKIAMEAAQR